MSYQGGFSIPTTYNNLEFRSRLEARYAVFFDGLGIEWTYEPMPFLLKGLGGYLPDFYLQTLNTFVEIKPTAPTEIQIAKLAGVGEITGCEAAIFWGRFQIKHGIWVDPRCYGLKVYPVDYEAAWFVLCDDCGRIEIVDASSGGFFPCKCGGLLGANHPDIMEAAIRAMNFKFWVPQKENPIKYQTPEVATSRAQRN